MPCIAQTDQSKTTQNSSVDRFKATLSISFFCYANRTLRITLNGTQLMILGIWLH